MLLLVQDSIFYTKTTLYILEIGCLLSECTFKKKRNTELNTVLRFFKVIYQTHVGTILFPTLDTTPAKRLVGIANQDPNHLIL